MVGLGGIAVKFWLAAFVTLFYLLSFSCTCLLVSLLSFLPRNTNKGKDGGRYYYDNLLIMDLNSGSFVAT